jgi:hypothetical protein
VLDPVHPPIGVEILKTCVAVALASRDCNPLLPHSGGGQSVQYYPSSKERGGEMMGSVDLVEVWLISIFQNHSHRCYDSGIYLTTE